MERIASIMANATLSSMSLLAIWMNRSEKCCTNVARYGIASAFCEDKDGARW